MPRTILRDDERMFELVRDDDGRLRLNVVVGGIGMYEISVALTREESEQFEQEGTAYIEDLAYRIAKSPKSYQDRAG